VVEHKKISVARKFEPQVLRPICEPIQSVGKKFLGTYKLELPENLKVHSIFHVLFLKSVSRDASRPNQEHNSRPSPNLIHNELEFEVEIVFKSKHLRGRMTHSQLLEGLKCESQIENNRRIRSRGMFFGSQHFGGVEGRVGAPRWD